MSTLKVDAVKTTGGEDRSLLRSWLSYNGSTANIRASSNVSSVTDNGVGNYTVNFGITWPNVGYSSVCAANAPVDTHHVHAFIGTWGTTGTYSTTAMQMAHYRDENSADRGDPARTCWHFTR